MGGGRENKGGNNESKHGQFDYKYSGVFALRFGASEGIPDDPTFQLDNLHFMHFGGGCCLLYGERFFEPSEDTEKTMR
jgi:hypothetical protein